MATTTEYDPILDKLKSNRFKDLLVKNSFLNYNPCSEDIGIVQTSDLRGYGIDYISDKALNYCKVGGSADATNGSIKVVSGTLKIYLNGAWEDVVTNFRFREDSTGAYELEHKPVGFTLWIEVSSGNSNLLGLNGLPIVQQYGVSMGANPVPLQVDGGTF